MTIESKGCQAGIHWCRRTNSQDILDLADALDNVKGPYPIPTYNDAMKVISLSVMASIQFDDDIPADMRNNCEFWQGFTTAVNCFGQMIAANDMCWGELT